MLTPSCGRGLGAMMMTDDDTHRVILWTDAAKRDLVDELITYGEWKAIHAAIKRVSTLHYVTADYAVVKVAQCDRRWYRIKLTEPRQLRIAFSLEWGDPPRMIVQAVKRRTGETYNLFEVLFRKAG